MNYYLYGFIETGTMKKYGQIGFDLPNQGKSLVAAIPHQNVGAVVGSTPFGNFGNLDKETLVRALLAHQETLEKVMKMQFVLPCKFGTTLEDENELQTILFQNQALLSNWIQKMRNTREMNVIATWEVPAMLKEIAAADPSVLDIKEKVALGKKLSEKLKERAAQFSQTILETLQEPAPFNVNHECMNDSMVCNVSFLLLRGREKNFFEKLDYLDNHFNGKLNFKCVGPLPPYSFSTVILRRFPPNEIEEAIRVLGLKGEPNSLVLKKIYKEKAKAFHPDVHKKEETSEAFKKIHWAYKLLKAYDEGGAKPIQLSFVRAEALER